MNYAMNKYNLPMEGEVQYTESSLDNMSQPSSKQAAANEPSVE